MTATDELRRLLDERGVEWSAFGDECADQTLVHTERFGRCAVIEWSTGLDVHLFNLTPEQAIEATLGRGTCHSDNNPPLLYDDPFRVFRCSECHHKVDLRRNPKPNYCPNCGRRVVDA